MPQARRQIIDTVPIHLKLGYSKMIECRAIRAELTEKLGAEEAKGVYFEFAVEAEYLRRHHNDPTLRERQAAARAALGAPPEPKPVFTREQLERIAEQFAGANDPLSISVLETVLRML